jgi:hypothetical protein
MTHGSLAHGDRGGDQQKHSPDRSRKKTPETSHRPTMAPPGAARVGGLHGSLMWRTTALRERLLDLPLPEHPAALDDLVAALRDVLPHAMGSGHPATCGSDRGLSLCMGSSGSAASEDGKAVAEELRAE